MRTPILTLAAALCLVAGQASAHAHLVQADPHDGSVLGRPPARLWLRFDEIVRLPGSQVLLTYPDGRTVRLSPVTRDPKDDQAVIAPAPAPLPPGRYTVRWRALSPLAYHTKGAFSFTLGR